MDVQPAGSGNWFGALSDPAIARALRLIHEQPQDAWTVAALADRVLLSRATFARRFTRLVGEPPLAYVARWRMNLAAKALRETGRSIDEIARAVGYESGPAFSKAFSRVYERSPGRYRSGSAS
jgi:transcriptional regulator GlxA family with amidase domain